jgi:hypothetical protein
LVTQAKWALEADRRLRKGAARLAGEAKARVARRAPFGELNGVAASAAATCGGARGALRVGDVAAAAGALDGDVEMRAVQPASSRVVAVSALGDAAGAVVAPPAGLLEASCALDALDGAEAGGSIDDLRGLPYATEAHVGRTSRGDGGGRCTLLGDTPVATLDDDDSMRGAADSAGLRGSAFADMPPLRRGDVGYLSQVVGGAIPGSTEAKNAIDALSLTNKPSGRLAGVLLDAKLIAVDEATGTVGEGPLIDELRKADAEKRKETGSKSPVRWYIYKILLVAAQIALGAGRLRFQTKQISVFRCVYGRFSIAATLWAAGVTMLEAMKMQLPLLWVPLEVRVGDLHKLPPWVRAAFPRGLYFESTDQIKELLQRSNGLFFDCKCWLFHAIAGVAATGSALALTAVGAGAGSRAVRRGAKRSRALVSSSAPGGSSDAVSSLFSAGVDYAAIDFSSLPTCARRGSALLSSQLGLPLPTSVPYFWIRFHKPASETLTDWFLVDDFARVFPELRRNDWNPVPDWVFASKTLRALAAGAALIFPGVDIRHVTNSPTSLLNVFDPTYQCNRDRTYTIWAGVDFVIVLPDGRVLDKRLFLLELLKAHADAA